MAKKNDRARVKSLVIAALPAMYKEAYLQANPDKIRKSALVSPQFKDEALETSATPRARD